MIPYLGGENMTAVVTKKAKKVSILEKPWCRDSKIIKTVKTGDKVDVKSNYCYGWNDRLYVELESGKGWIVVEGLVFLERNVYLTADGLYLHTKDNALYLLKKVGDSK